MSEEQLSALIAKLKNDPGLQESLNNATSYEDAVAIAKEAGLDLSLVVDDSSELEDEELELIAGGSKGRFFKSLFKSLFKKNYDCANRC